MQDFYLDFVGVGPQRTGTTWLHEVLQDHPSICLPQNIKETMFFDRYFEQGLSWYAGHFTECQSPQRRGEIGPTYFDQVDVPLRIHQLNPACKIIINLRNPIDHALSLYHHHLAKGRVKGLFADAVDQMPQLLQPGRYAQHIPRWLDQFGRKQVAFVWLDDVKSTPQTVFDDICNFLDIELRTMPAKGQEKIYAGKRARFPWLARIAVSAAYWLRSKRSYHLVNAAKSLGFGKLVYSKGKSTLPTLTATDRNNLLETFEPDIAFLENFLSRDLSVWRQMESEKAYESAT